MSFSQIPISGQTGQDEIVRRFTEALEQRIADEPTLLGHRNDLDGYNLAALDTGEARQIRIAFCRPNVDLYVRLTKDIVDAFAAAHPGNSGILSNAWRENFTAHFGPEQSWSAERTHGDLTVSFSETTGHISSDNTWPVAINGVLLLVKDKNFSLKKHFAEAVGLCDALNKLEGDGVRNFSKKVEVVAEGVIGSRDSGIPLQIGQEFWALAEGQGKEFYEVILRHERKHILQGDLDMSAYYTRALHKLEKAVAPIALFQSLAKPQLLLHEAEIDKKQEVFRASIAYLYPDEEAVKGLFVELDKTLTEITPRITRLAERVESYPGFEEMDAFSVAIDRLGKNAFGKYLVDMPELPIFGERNAIDDFQASMGNLPPVILAPAQETDRLIRTKLDALHEKHAVLYDHLVTLETCIWDVAQAKEILADLDSVEHADDLSKVGLPLRRLAEKMPRIADIPSRHHPSHRQRIKTADSFAESVAEARAENAGKQTER